jgi:hypothetical protein
MTIQQPVIPVEVALGGPLRGLDGERVAVQAGQRIGALAADLGIPGEVQVTVRGDDGPDAPPVTIAVHGAPLDYPWSLGQQVLVWHRHRREPDAAGNSRLPSWQDQMAASEGDSVTAVAELAGHAAAADASSMLGPEQVSAWLERAAMPATEGIGDVLVTLLDLRLSIGDHSRIAALVAGRPNASAADTVEHVVEAVRRDTLEVRVEPSYLEEITTTGFDANPAVFPFLRDGLYAELGLRLPRLRLVPDPEMAARCLAIRVNDVTTPPVVGIPPGMCLVNALVTQLAAAPDIREALNPATGEAGAYVPANLRAELEQSRYTTWDPIGHLVLTVAEAARVHVRALVDRTVVASELDLFSRLQPVLAQSAQAIIPITRLTRLLRSLLDERVPVRDLRCLLQALIDHEVTSGLPESDEALLALARRAFGAAITGKASQWGSIRALLIDPVLAAGLVSADGTAGEARRSLVAALGTEMAAPGSSATPALLTTADARLAVRRAIRGAWPRITVLALEELSPAATVLPLGRLSSASS